MRSGASRAELLSARDRRQVAIDRHLGTGHPSLVAASLNLPGPEKRPPGAEALFRWAVARLSSRLPGAVLLDARHDAAGPFALLAAQPGPVETKLACVAVEAAHPAARLVDLDVYAPGGAAIDRAALGLPPRPCLLCGAPARECMRLRRHLPEEVVARALALLADLPA